jgi:Zn ribbon nucleic-acid-binding protein
MVTWVQSPAYRPNLAAAVTPADHPTPKLIMQPVCKHPKVRVVAREDDVEYVECEECGEVFDADEYQEMSQDLGDETHAEADDA